MDHLPKDLLIELALDLDLPEVIKFCGTSQRINKTVCESDIFWMKRFIRDYGDYPKTTKTTETWKEFYYKILNTSGYDLLWEGLMTNNLDLVKFGVEKDPSKINVIRREEDFNHMPLSYASENGNLEIVKYLIEHGALIYHSVVDASKNGHLEVVKYLTDHGANIRNPLGFLALKFAISHGHLDVVKYLVEQGADVRAADDYALRAASANGHLEVVKYLESLITK